MSTLSSVVPANDRPSALANLGLTEEVIQAAMRAALVQSRRVTEFHPLGWDNNELYGEGIARLRELLQPFGWTTFREAKFEGVLNAAATIAIIVSSGTRETGREDGRAPRTKNPKGSATQHAVDANQGELFGDPTAVPGPNNPPATLMLLHFLDFAADELRLELSLPKTMRGKQVVEWDYRIPIAAVPLGLRTTTLNIPAEEDEEVPVIEVAWRNQGSE